MKAPIIFIAAMTVLSCLQHEMRKSGTSYHNDCTLQTKVTPIYCFIWLFITAIIVVCNSPDKEKPYSLSIQDNSLYITMPYPTIGIVGINEVSWRGVDLDEVMEDVFNILKKKHLTDTYSLYVKYVTTSTDKYGYEEKIYDESFLLEVPIEEVQKYKDSKYFSKSYDIKGKLYETAFDRQRLNGSDNIPVFENNPATDTVIVTAASPTSSPVRMRSIDEIAYSLNVLNHRKTK